tara:strand:- start:1577 stop:1912 length:336 start_codon:yes stop_codon:yes gene_type:complete
MENEKTPVKVTVVKTIYEALKPIYYKLLSLTDDVMSNRYPLSDYEKSLLLEQASYASTLKHLFEEILDEAIEESVNTVFLEKEEFKNIIYMSKCVEISSKVVFKNTGIWSH